MTLDLRSYNSFQLKLMLKVYHREALRNGGRQIWPEHVAAIKTELMDREKTKCRT